MKRFKYLLFLLPLLFFLTGCTNNADVVVNLYVGNDELYQTYNLEQGDMLTLPIYSSDDTKIYVGWDNQSTSVYSGTITVTRDEDLYLVEENISDVIDFGSYTSEAYALSVYGYTGQAKYLKLPTHYDGLPITNISSEAFTGDNLVEIYLSNYIGYVDYNAFIDLDNLQKVEFYGEVELIDTDIMAGSELERIIESESCTVAEEIAGVTYYNSECYIKSSTLDNEVTIGDVVYSSYFVTYDINGDLSRYNQQLKPGSFVNCPKLETVIMPYGAVYFEGAFKNTPMLTNIEFVNDVKYEVIDSVVYLKNDPDNLAYYPSGLTDTSYSIPETVKTIRPYAFYGNPYLEEIIIHDEVEVIYESAFNDLQSLERYTVENGNEIYYSEDGVLFMYTNDSILALHKYPDNKSGNSYTIPNDVIFINEFCFAYNNNLTNINISESVIYIGNGAFQYSEKLKVLDFPDSIEYIGFGIIQGSAVDTIVLRKEAADISEVPTLGSLLGYVDYDRQITIYMSVASMAVYSLDTSWALYYDSFADIETYINN